MQGLGDGVDECESPPDDEVGLLLISIVQSLRAPVARDAVSFFSF